MLPSYYKKRKYGSSGSTTSRAMVIAGPRAFYRGSRMQSVKRARRRNTRTAGFLGIEKKFYDTSKVNLDISNAGAATGAEADPNTIKCISAPSQGDGESQRDGRKMMIKSIQVTGTVSRTAQADQTAADASANVYIALVQDTQSNATQLNSEDVFINPSTSVATIANPLINMQYSQRFKVLGAKKFTLPVPTMSFDGTNIEQSGVSKTFKFFKTCNIPVSFQSTTEGITNVIDNSLHIIAFTDATNAVPTLSYNSRIRFVG